MPRSEDARPGPSARRGNSGGRRIPSHLAKSRRLVGDGAGFQWAEIDPGWQDWSLRQYRDALDHPRAREGFSADKEGMEWAEVCVLLELGGSESYPPEDLEEMFRVTEGRLRELAGL